MAASSDLLRERLERLAAARLYLICDSTPPGRTLPDLLRAAVAGGVDVVQLRDKRLDEDRLARTAHRTAQLCRALGALFFVNDRPEIARDARADGVHVGQQDMPVAQARELVGAELLIGLSTHAPDEIEAVGREVRMRGTRAAGGTGDNPRGVDYIGVGPVYATPTKPGRPATGLELVRHAAQRAPVPYFAIGGIHAENSAAVLAAGARRLAVVRAIAEASDPQSAARELRTTIDSAGERPCFRFRAP